MPATNLGQPCWEIDNIAKVISPIAQLDDDHIDYFLATHAPIEQIRHDETQELLNEESFFQELVKPSHGEVLAVVHGDPGTGKSHLIHWLKLRCDDALGRQEVRNIIPILIQRRTGSLKDALEQMIRQLPPDFEHYLKPIKEALNNISDSTAREMLANELRLELGSRRDERERAQLPRSLRNLSEVCASTGFRQWLCRDGGVIDKNIKRLTQERGETDPDALPPQFISQEFYLVDRNKRDNTPEVLGLIDDFFDEPLLGEQAATYFNEALPDAIKEMTGLSGTKLRDVFDQIRADLRKRGNELALFIEDVSVMSALDEEVFVALEPQKRQGLCRMIAVVGATNQGWNRLPDNQRQRVTHPVSLGGRMTDEWRRDPQAVAEFTARYMNAMRLQSSEVSEIAQHRRNGRDVNITACQRCQIKDECHAVFGKVNLSGSEIGLFPFTDLASQRMLENLQGHVAVHKNQRGLLTRILQPILDRGHEDLETNSFPSVKLAVTPLPISYWTGFEERFCGGWNERDKSRLKFLAQFWMEAQDTDEAATKLAPLLKPFGFREFTRAVTSVPKPASPRPATNEKREQKTLQPTLREAENEELNKLLHNLEKWMAGDVLVGDPKAREMLADMIRRSISWDNYGVPPLETWKILLGEGSNYKFVNIEGMRSKQVGTKFSISFPRTKETRDVLEALAQFEYVGNRSWSFPHGELHKRTLASWLRRHEIEIVQQLQPQNALDTQTPIACAVQLLATYTLVRRRTKLPDELPELLKALLSEDQAELPTALSKEWRQLIEDMRLKREEIKQFLLRELDIPQGRGARTINFINPLPVIQSAVAFTNNPQISLPGDDYNKDFWHSRYGVFEKASKYAELTLVLDRERTAISDLTDRITLLLRTAEYDIRNPSEAIINYCGDLTDTIQAQKKAGFFLPNSAFDELIKRKVFAERKEVWATAVRKAQEVAKDTDPMSVMLFETKNLKEAGDCLDIAEKYRSLLEKEVEDKLQYIEQEGDPDQLTSELLQTLEVIATLAKTN